MFQKEFHIDTAAFGLLVPIPTLPVGTTRSVPVAYATGASLLGHIFWDMCTVPSVVVTPVDTIILLKYFIKDHPVYSPVGVVVGNGARAYDATPAMAVRAMIAPAMYLVVFSIR
jgi:hypothetical protein